MQSETNSILFVDCFIPLGTIRRIVNHDNTAL